MELNEVLKALNKIRYIAVSDEIMKYDLKEINNFMNCFFKLISSDISHLEAYLKIEEIYKRKYGVEKYSNFETFKTTMYRWRKSQKS